MNSHTLPLHPHSLSTEKPKPNLLSLGSDIHHRIVDYLIYPVDGRKKSELLEASESTLSLAMTCRTMQAVVASRFNTDRPFWCGPDETNASPFHWYRVCSSSLTSIVFRGDKIPDDDAFIHILHILISRPPPVRSLDLRIISYEGIPRGVFSNLVLFLQCIRTTLTNLEMKEQYTICARHNLPLC